MLPGTQKSRNKVAIATLKGRSCHYGYSYGASVLGSQDRPFSMSGLKKLRVLEIKNG